MSQISSQLPTGSPPGLPPMSVPPPQMPPMYLPPAPQQNNVAAIISLIAGLIMCVPGLGLLAVILGIVGLVQASKPNVGGKGMAIAGLILGLIASLGWVVGGAAVGIKARQMFIQGAPARAVATRFATAVGKGDADGAIAECSTGITPDTVRATVTQAQSQAWGALQSANFFSFGFKDQNGLKTVALGGNAVFTNAKKSFTATLDFEDGVWKITVYNFAGQ